MLLARTPKVPGCQIASPSLGALNSLGRVLGRQAREQDDEKPRLVMIIMSCISNVFISQLGNIRL